MYLILPSGPIDSILRWEQGYGWMISDPYTTPGCEYLGAPRYGKAIHKEGEGGAVGHTASQEGPQTS